MSKSKLQLGKTRTLQLQQSKENNDLKEQVRQLSNKLSELTTRVNRPVSQQTTETNYGQQYTPPRSTGNYYGSYTQQPVYTQPTHNGFQGQQQQRLPDYPQQDTARQSPTYGQQPAPYNQQDVTTTRLCYGCGTPNHFRKDCPAPRQRSIPQRDATKEEPPTNARGVTRNDKHRGHVYIELRINGRVHACLLDTGCDVSIIPADLVYRCNVTDANQKVLAANGTEIPILGKTTLHAKLGEQEVQIEGLVSEHVNDVMICIGWLQTNGVIWNFAEAEIVFNKVRYPLSPSKRGSRRVILAEDQTLPPRSQLDLNTKVVYDSLRASNGNEIEA